MGYYALATGSVDRKDVPGKVKKNMLDPIPIILIGRLAIDREFAGRGVGYGLLKDALSHIAKTAE